MKLNNEIDYIIKRTNRQSISLEVCEDGRILVRTPHFVSTDTINKFVNNHLEWIKSAKIRVQKSNEINASIDIRKSELKGKAEHILPDIVNYYSDLMRLYPSSVKITSAKKRFGSCSGSNGICFSWRLMAYPDQAIEYVVVHELAHIKYHNHGKQFYSLIEKYMPDYRERQKILRNSAKDN